MSTRGKHSAAAPVADAEAAPAAGAAPLDRRNPGDAFLEKETEDNRKGEYWLLGVAATAAAFVAVLVVIREVFFI